MVHRFFFRRFLFLSTFVTVSIIVFQTWSPPTSHQHVNLEQPEYLSPSKEELPFKQTHLDQLQRKLPIESVLIDHNINANIDDAEYYANNQAESNDLKNGDISGDDDNVKISPPLRPQAEVGHLPDSNIKAVAPPAEPKTGEIEKTDESLTVEPEDLTTSAIQETVSETNNGLKITSSENKLKNTPNKKPNGATIETHKQPKSPTIETQKQPNGTPIETHKKPNGTTVEIQESREKYWFFKNGTVRPSKPDLTSRGSKIKWKIWPHQAPNDDRIVDQLMYVPDTYDSSQVKTILVANNLYSWGVHHGPSAFHECPVNACTISTSWKKSESADAILFQDSISVNHDRKPSQIKQIWIIYELESAVHSSLYGLDSLGREQVNWTATYRMDSDIVTPYEKWVYYDVARKTDPNNAEINFAAGKTHQVAWFVSNCHAGNTRLEYARELQEFIPVDIYGACGPLQCPRFSQSHCFDLLDSKYKFYLSFENSNCKDYITEKFFVTGLSHNVIPIVMGASKSEYLRSAPLNSFIHVDDFASPQHLAKYLHHLDQNDTAYNAFFQWKGTGEFINTFFWCRLCTMVHDGGSAVLGKYTDVQRWWNEDACEKNNHDS